MKKFISLLLSFIVLLSCFVVPTYAESVDVSSGDYYIRRKICSLDVTTNQYKEVAATTIFSDDLNSTWSYEISNSYLLNPTRKYFNYYSVAKTDNSLLCKNGNDLTIEMFAFSDMLMAQDISYKFNVDNVNVECGFINAQGEMRVLDSSCVELRNNTTPGYYDIIIRVPYQDEDIYSVYCRLYYVLNEGFDAPSSFFGQNALYLMVNGSLNIDIDKADKSVGLLNSILDGLKSIWEWICNFFYNLGNLLGNLLNGIVDALNTVKDAITNTIDKIQNWLLDLLNGIIEGLKSLFLLPDGYFNDKFSSLYDKLVTKLGILSLPCVLIENLVSAYLNLPNGDGVIEIIPIEFFGVKLFNSSSVNFVKIIADFLEPLDKIVGFSVWDTYYLFVDGILILAFIGYCSKKYYHLIGR